MRREEAHVGLLVVFGMPGEEQTTGKVLKLNRARAKVQALKPRAGRPVGTKFNVPYHLIRPANDTEAPAAEEVELQKTKPRNSF